MTRFHDSDVSLIFVRNHSLITLDIDVHSLNKNDIRQIKTKRKIRNPINWSLHVR